MPNDWFAAAVDDVDGGATLLTIEGGNGVEVALNHIHFRTIKVENRAPKVIEDIVWEVRVEN